MTPRNVLPGYQAICDLVEAGNGFHMTDHSRAHLLIGKRTAKRSHVLDEMVTHFKKKADQFSISSSFAKSGNGRP